MAVLGELWIEMSVGYGSELKDHIVFFERSYGKFIRNVC